MYVCFCQQQLMLDSPALIDLSHGTVRYRHPDEKRGQDNAKIKTGYFYHPRLDDFSEGTCMEHSDFLFPSLPQCHLLNNTPFSFIQQA